MTQIEASEFSVFLDAMAGEFERINMAPALQRCVPVIIEGVQSHFQQAVSPFGTPWPPRVDGSTDSLLVKSGAMRAAATGGPGNVTRIEGNILTYGVSKAVIPYAAVHNFGHPPFNIAERRYLGMNPGTIERCEEEVREEVLEVVFR